jgi:sarcosine oxidase, subunit beta
MTVDAIVIGAGVIGSAVAYELALQGSRVLVVDKGAGVGQGSTGASSAVVRYHYSTFDGVALAWESRACWAEWPEHLGAPRQTDLAALCHTGVVILDAPITPRARMRELFEQVGVPYEEWDSQTLRGRVPGLDPGRFWPPKRIDDEAFWTDATDQLGAVFTPDGGFIDDPMLATQNLAGAASRLGVRFRLKAAVSEVRTAHGRVAGISFANGE